MYFDKFHTVVFIAQHFHHHLFIHSVEETNMFKLKTFTFWEVFRKYIHN